MNVIKAVLVLALASSTPALSQLPKVAPDQKPDGIERIVKSDEFQAAAKKRDLPRMNKLLGGTGAIAADPVAIFYCRPPTIPTFMNGAWYCAGGGTRPILVHPYMYAQ